MRSDMFREVPDHPDLVFAKYEQIKREFQNTQVSCEAEGFRFLPMVFEAHGGGWSSAARKSLDWLARREAAAQGARLDTVSLRTAQRISATLHRESARAVLRRLSCTGGNKAATSAWDAPRDVIE